MNKKFAILSAILVPILLYVMFKVYFLTGLHEINMQIVDSIRRDEKLESHYRIFVSLFILVILSLNSLLCFQVAKKKNRDPWKWAKYGFIYNIWATIYLLLSSKDNDPASA